MAIIPIDMWTRDFRFCTLSPDGRSIYELHPSGRVVCPLDKGGWEGELRHQGGGFWLDYDNPKEEPRRIKVYFNEDAATKYAGGLRSNAAYNLREAEKIEGLIQAVALLGRKGQEEPK